MLEAVYSCVRAHQRASSKRGSMELEELVRLIIFIIVLVVVGYGAYLLFFQKGGRVITSVRDLFTFG